MAKTVAPRVLILFSLHFPQYTVARRTKVKNRQIPTLAILKLTNNQHKSNLETPANHQPEACISVPRSRVFHTLRIARICDDARYSGRYIEQAHDISESPHPESGHWHIWGAFGWRFHDAVLGRRCRGLFVSIRTIYSIHQQAPQKADKVVRDANETQPKRQLHVLEKALRESFLRRVCLSSS
jgi:hypothetical protein